jgi:hypothetical protein
MPSVRVERLPVSALGLGLLGFDHLQIVYQSGPADDGAQDRWFVMEGVRVAEGPDVRLAVEGWHGGTTLSEANGGLTGEELARRIGTQDERGGREIATGHEAVRLWATLVSLATDFEAQHFPYIAYALPGSVLPTLNSSSLVASLLHHAGIDIGAALPDNLRLSPGTTTLLGTSHGDTIALGQGFTTLVAGDGPDDLSGSNDNRINKLYGGRGDDVLHWSQGLNVLHGGQPGLAAAEDGHDAVDYSGAGTVLIEALPSHGRAEEPEFVVSFPGGRDHLISIEELRWDASRDRIVTGEGVGLLEQPLKIEIRPGQNDAEVSPRRARLDVLLDTGPLIDVRLPDAAHRPDGGGTELDHCLPPSAGPPDGLDHLPAADSGLADFDASAPASLGVDVLRGL